MSSSDSTQRSPRLALGALALLVPAIMSWGACKNDSATPVEKETCAVGFIDCGGACVDTRYDPAHCGVCGTTCSSAEVCSQGKCSLTCLGGTLRCGDACVDTSLDPLHCGACDAPCAGEEVCSQGTCGVACGGGTTMCGDACVDTDFDPGHCGGCDEPCPAGEVCSMGDCGITCLGGTTKCGDGCVDTDLDPAHCGDCDDPCPAGEVCSMGTCGVTCLGGTTLCGSACVETDLDPAHCGGCNDPCAQGELCSAGLCALTCSGGTTLCGNLCVDTTTDEAFCGDCVTSCQGGASCSEGHCCPGGSAWCGSSCVDVTQSVVDCGTCGHVCNAGELCIAGACSVTPLLGADGRGGVAGSLYAVDPVTGSATVLAPLVAAYAGIAITNGLLFGATTTGLLTQINPSSGTEEILTSLSDYGPRGLAVRSDGLLLACNQSSEFITADAVTGTVSVLGSGCDYGIGIAVNSMGTVYYVSNGSLYTLDAQASTTLVTNVSSSSTLRGATFHNGTLYAIEKSGGGGEARAKSRVVGPAGAPPPVIGDNLVTIDIVDGTVTFVAVLPLSLHALASATP